MRGMRPSYIEGEACAERGWYADVGTSRGRQKRREVQPLGDRCAAGRDGDVHVRRSATTIGARRPRGRRERGGGPSGAIDGKRAR